MSSDRGPASGRPGAVPAEHAGWRRFPALPWVAAALLLLDAVFLHHVARTLPSWGIWDWDLQESIFEVARRSLLVDGEWPLWDRFRGGGWTLVGNPLARTANPSFLPVLAFGTIPGIKVVLWLWPWIGQLGFLALLRERGLGPWPALLGAFTFAWGGCFAQHLTHGHFEWVAYFWLPWVLFALHRAWARATPARIAAAAVALALLWLDGGPYQLVFTILYVALYATAWAVAARSPAAIATAAAVGVLAVALSAVQLAPVVETARRIPRPTAEATGYYGMRAPPSLAEVLVQGFVSRDQGHDPEAWMPLRINVGTWLGALPLLLAAGALARPRRTAWLAAVLAASLWMTWSEELPVGPWSWLHALPGFGSLQVPARFNVFVAATLAMLAAFGLDALAGRRRTRALGPLVVVLAAADLFAVNAGVFRVAFAVPPIAVEPHGSFAQYATSPWRDRYRETVLEPVRPNWPNATFPAIRENRGVILAYRDLIHPRRALAFDDPAYPGAEVAAVGALVLDDVRFTSNRVTFSARGDGGRVVVNQNYHPDWRVVRGEGARLARDRGRLAVELPPGRHEIELAFRPPAFRWGAAVSAVAWLGVVGVALYSRYPRARNAS